MGIGNLPMITLKSTEGICLPAGIYSREGVPYLCCVSGYCGAILAFILASYLWSSWREPLVLIGQRSMQLYAFVFPNKPNIGVGLEMVVIILINPIEEMD